jgi:hypothetical protein
MSMAVIVDAERAPAGLAWATSRRRLVEEPRGLHHLQPLLPLGRKKAVEWCEQRPLDVAIAGDRRFQADRGASRESGARGDHPRTAADDHARQSR